MFLFLKSGKNCKINGQNYFKCKFNQKTWILYENRSNFLWSERLQEMVSFLLSLSCTYTIAIIKGKLSRIYSIQIIWNYLVHSVKVVNMDVKEWNKKERKERKTRIIKWKYKILLFEKALK